LWEHGLDGRVRKVHRSGDDVVAPPVGRVDVIQSEGEEDGERAEGEAEVEAGGSQEVQAAPPGEVALADVILEQEAHDAPGQVIEWRGWRDGARTAEDDWRHEVLDGRFRPLLGGKVDDDRYNRADAKEDEEA
jgi:hypothetical protein